jgi:hypothetical protein
MATSSASKVRNESIAFGRMWWVTLLTIGVASVANIVVYVIATALFEGPRRFALLNPTSIVVSTAAFLVVAAIVYALMGRFAQRPIHLFRRVAFVTLLLSFLGPISTAYTLPTPDAPDTATVVTLMVMHTVAALITVGMFIRMARAA